MCGSSSTVNINDRNTLNFELDHLSPEGCFEWIVASPNTEITIRDIQIRDVSRGQPPEPAFQPLFNGKDLRGWKLNEGKWAVKDAVEEGFYVQPVISSYAPQVGERFALMTRLETKENTFGTLHYYRTQSKKSDILVHQHDQTDPLLHRRPDGAECLPTSLGFV